MFRNPSTRWRFALAFLLLLFVTPPALLPHDTEQVQEQKTWLPLVTGGSQAFTFVSWADTKSGTAVLAALSQQASRLHPAFTIFPGDLESNGFTSAGMNRWTAAMNAGSGMAQLVFPLRGNHDTSNQPGWQAYFNLANRAASLGMAGFTELDEDLTYAFTYQNALFIGLDVPGDAPLQTGREIAFLDAQLAAAEKRGLVHAFVFFHGPLYPVSNYSDCPARTCPTPPQVAAVVEVLNRHPILSALFHGHEHLQAYVHLDSSRITELRRPVEEFITGSAGAELHSCSNTFRFDFCGSYPGFAAVEVAGRAFTVRFYQQGEERAVKEYRFQK